MLWETQCRRLRKRHFKQQLLADLGAQPVESKPDYIRSGFPPPLALLSPSSSRPRELATTSFLPHHSVAI